MSYARRNPHQDELQRTLGQTRPGVSNTLPIEATRSLGGYGGSGVGAMPEGGWDTPDGRNQIKVWGRSLFGGAPDPVAASGVPSTSASGPWGRGEIRGSARPGANFARLGGGFGDANTDSMKHTFGRIAQNFDHTPAGLQALMNDPEFRSLFPNARLDKDWIDFGGQVDPHTGTQVGKVDVMHAWDPSNNSGKNWQWLTEEEALAGAGGGNAGAGGRGRMASVMPGQQSDLLQQIMASLQLQQQPNQDPQALLLQYLQG